MVQLFSLLLRSLPYFFLAVEFSSKLLSQYQTLGIKIKSEKQRLQTAEIKVSKIES